MTEPSSQGAAAVPHPTDADAVAQAVDAALGTAGTR